ncbi:hypothetical protein PPACK8108_LOCUS26278 [Phakopsora pachyrhizi]|uniref:Uncharacterized protein n=1 Tax=Phakopsora pachyrhizi TaxID=170000 RepID=A0AAV0BTD6_PHAPC|nr:hypothetical protein PPACK8108_LOCUS26278 [Phakopsora pachyrhizi]
MTVLIDGKLEDPLIKDKKVSLLGWVICGQKISMGSVSEGSSCAGLAEAEKKGQAGAGARWLGLVRMGRLGAGLWAGRQAGAWLWAGKGRLGQAEAWLWQARLWAGKAGWGRLWLGPNGQAGARLWAGKAGWGRLWLGPNGQAGASLGLSPGRWAARCWNEYPPGQRAGNGLVDGGVNLGIKNLKRHKVIARERGKGQSDRRAGHTHTQAEGNRATELIKTEGRPTEDYTRRKIEIPTGGAFRGGFAGRAGQAQLSSALLGWVLGRQGRAARARLGLAGSRAGRANDLALKNKYKERRGRLGWVLDNLGSLAGGRFDLQKPDKNETSTNSSCPRTPKMEKKPKKEKPPGIEENPPKGKTPLGKETSVKDGFKGKTPLAGKGNTVNFE